MRIQVIHDRYTSLRDAMLEKARQDDPDNIRVHFTAAMYYTRDPRAVSLLDMGPAIVPFLIEDLKAQLEPGWSDFVLFALKKVTPKELAPRYPLDPGSDVDYLYWLQWWEEVGQYQHW
jgi:hypothetical protein